MIGPGHLRTISSVGKGDFAGYFLLKAEVSSFLIPDGKGGGDGVHGLDMVHNPSGYSGGKVGDKGCSVFYFIVFCSYDVQLEHTGILLELFSSINASGGQPSHGFPGGIGVHEGGFKIGLELSECSKQQGGQSLLAVDFCPRGSGSLLHIREGKGDLSIVVMIEGVVDQEVESDRVQPSLSGLGFSIIFLGTSDRQFGNPRTGGWSGRQCRHRGWFDMVVATGNGGSFLDGRG